MANVNNYKIKTLKDYIYLLCKSKGITMKQMCADIDIPYTSFKAQVSKSISTKRLLKIMKYLDGDFVFAFDLPLTVDKNDSDKIKTKACSDKTDISVVSKDSNSLIDNFKYMVFDSSEEYLQQYYDFVKDYDRLHNIKSKLRIFGRAGKMLTLLKHIVVEPLEIDGKEEYRFYVRRWDEPTYTVLTKSYVQEFIFDIVQILNLEKQSSWPRLNTILDDLTFAAYDEELPLYNPAPAYYVLTLNGIFNRKTKEFYPNKSDEYYAITKKYQFIDNASFNYLTKSDKPEIVDLYKNFINQISDYDENVKNEIERQLCSVLNGYSEDGLTFVMSKSKVNLEMFGELLRRLAGNCRHAFMEINKIRSGRSLDLLSYDLKLIIDSFEGKIKLSGQAIENCKRVFGRRPFITRKNGGYKTYFKLRAPWFQFVFNEKDLKSLEYDTRDMKTNTIKISNHTINRRFVNKFYDMMDANTNYGPDNVITTFSDEIASYLLNTVDYSNN